MLRIREDARFYAATGVRDKEEAAEVRQRLLQNVCQYFLDPNVYERRLRSEMKLQIFKQKAPAMLFSCLEKNPYAPTAPNPYFLLPAFAENTILSSSTFFIIGSFKRVFDMRIMQARAPPLYEIITGFTPCHIHFDADAETEHNPRLQTPEGENELFELFITELITFIRDTFKEIDLGQDDIVVNLYKTKQVEGKKKVSYHLVVKIKGHAMANNYCVGAFVRRFELEMIRKYGNPDEIVEREDGIKMSKNPLFIYNRTGRQIFFVDMIYTYDRNFRMLNCGKADDPEFRPKKLAGYVTLDANGQVVVTPPPQEKSKYPSFPQFLDSLVTNVAQGTILLNCTEANGKPAVSTSKPRGLWWLIDDKLYPKPKNDLGSSSKSFKSLSRVGRLFDDVIQPSCIEQANQPILANQSDSELIDSLKDDALRAIADKYPCYHGVEITKCTMHKSLTAVLTNPNVDYSCHDSRGDPNSNTVSFDEGSVDGYRFSLYLSISSKFCPLLAYQLNAHSPVEHRSNHVWLIFFLDTMEVVFKCYDGTSCCGMPFRDLPEGAKALARVKVPIEEDRKIAAWRALGYSKEWCDRMQETEARRERRTIDSFFVPKPIVQKSAPEGAIPWGTKVVAKTLFAASSRTLFDYDPNNFSAFLDVLLDKESDPNTQRVFSESITTYCTLRSSTTCPCGAPIKTLFALAKRGVEGSDFTNFVRNIIIKSRIECPLSILNGSNLCFYRVSICTACWDQTADSMASVEGIEEAKINGIAKKFKGQPLKTPFLLSDFTSLAAPRRLEF